MTDLINNRYSSTQGFTLIEVLIAVLVLSIGLLGLASLQANSLRNNYSAYMRSQASILANDMADRIRANPGTPPANTPLGIYGSLTGPISSGADCELTTCTPDELAGYDSRKWYGNLALFLPGGTGTVTRNGNLFTVTVMWDDNKTGATGTGCGGGAADLTCFSVTFLP